MNHQSIEVISQVISVVVVAAIVAAVWRVVESIKIRPSKRYFFLSFTYHCKDDNGTGNDFVINSKNYVNRNEYEHDMAAKIHSFKGLSDVTVIITNIIELSKSDYEDFNR